LSEAALRRTLRVAGQVPITSQKTVSTNSKGFHFARCQTSAMFQSFINRKRRVKSCPVQTPSAVPNVPKITAEVEELKNEVAVIS